MTDAACVAPAAQQPDPSAADFIDLARMDWLVSKSWRKLHAVRDEDWTDGHRADMEEHWGVSRPVRLACGRVAASAWIPGMFTRMGAERCSGCCRATGMPAGRGSPKNDDACRVLLGLPVERVAGLETAATEEAR